MIHTNDYCGECGLIGGGNATGCTDECPSPKGRALKHVQILVDALRPKVAAGEFLRIKTIDALPADEQDMGNLWAIVTDKETIISEDDSLPHPPGAEVPYGVVSWETGTASCVPLEYITVRH